MPTPFENFVNTELPKRIATNESPTTPQAGDIPIYTGVGLLTESKTPSEAGLATETFATNAANTAETNAKSYADDIITSIYKFQTTYNPQITGNFPTAANTVGEVAIKKGFTWVVSGITGQYIFQGVTVDNGDTLLALVDNASATSAADWHITEKNLGYTPENSSNKYSNNDLAGGAGTYPATPNVKAYVDNGLSGKQNTLADVITANTYGNSTQYPVITFNAKGIATGVTLQTVSVGEVSDSAFRIVSSEDTTKKLSFQASSITTGQTRTITMPDVDVDLGNVAQAASTSTAGYLTSADWNTFNNKLGLADVRFTFISDTGTTYTVPASSVTAAGKTIIELSNNSLTTITVATNTATGKSVGDSVNISITGTYNAQVLVAGAGVVLEGDLVFYYQYQTKTLILKNASTNTWKVVG